jgi:alkaline phosphatase D
MPTVPVPVCWQIARDERFRHVARSGTAWALPQVAHSVHVEVGGLQPDREWYYRFRYRHDVSPTGRTRTTPRAHSGGGTLAFPFASCQAWDQRLTFAA